MKAIVKKTLLLFVFLSFSLPFFPQANKMDWWHEAHFGMFIHWGVYSVYGNVYNGIDVTGNSK